MSVFQTQQSVLSLLQPAAIFYTLLVTYFYRGGHVMNKKIITRLLALVMATSLLTACGSS